MSRIFGGKPKAVYVPQPSVPVIPDTNVNNPADINALRNAGRAATVSTDLGATGTTRRKTLLGE